MKTEETLHLCKTLHKAAEQWEQHSQVEREFIALLKTQRASPPQSFNGVKDRALSIYTPFMESLPIHNKDTALSAKQKIYGTLCLDAQRREFVKVLPLLLERGKSSNEGISTETSTAFIQALTDNSDEETGNARQGQPHNNLFKNMITDVLPMGIYNREQGRNEKYTCPGIKTFTANVEYLFRTAPFDKMLGAITMYEEFDNPDYHWLEQVAKNLGYENLGFVKAHQTVLHGPALVDALTIHWEQASKAEKQQVIHGAITITMMQARCWQSFNNNILYGTESLAISQLLEAVMPQEFKGISNDAKWLNDDFCEQRHPNRFKHLQHLETASSTGYQMTQQAAACYG